MSTVDSLAEYYDKLQAIFSQALPATDKTLYKAIVNAPFYDRLHTTNMDLGIIVLLLVNNATKTIDRIAYSSTSPALGAIKVSPVPFEAIKIPLDERNNIIARAIRTKKSYQTSDWQHLFSPVLSANAARFNQAEAGMGCSVVYPFTGGDPKGALIYSFYQPIEMIGKHHHDFMKKYTKMVADKLYTV